jgi:TolA-binding protein
VIDSSKDEHSMLKAGAQLYSGLIAKAKGERDRAKKEFSALTMQTGYQLLGHALLEYGQLVYEDNEMETARKTFERALRETQEKSLSIKLHLLLGSVYHDLEQFGKSAREYASAERMVLSMSKRELENRESILAEARLKQGISLHQNEQYRDAIIELSTFLGEHKVDARRDQALFWLAESYYKTDLLSNAEEFYTQLTLDYPNSNRKEESMYGIAWSQFRRREFAKSSQSFSKLVKEYPQTRFATDALARKGDGHYALRQFKDAAAAYKSAMNSGPRSE